MRSARFFLLSLFAAGGVLVAACVGDDPGANSAGPTNDAGSTSDANGSAPNNPPPTPGEDGGDGGGDLGHDAGPAERILGNTLRFWLDAADVRAAVSNTVNQWKETWHASSDLNLSGQGDGNNPAIRPTLKTGADGINGLPAVHFENSAKVTFGDVPALEWGTSDYAVFAVVRFADDSSSPGCVWCKADGNGGLQIRVPGDEVNTNTVGAKMNNMSDLRPTYGTGTFGTRLITVTRSGVSFGVRVDRSERQSTSTLQPTDSVSAEGLALYLGYDGSSALKGDIAEVIAAVGAVTADQRDDIEMYLMTKYALGN